MRCKIVNWNFNVFESEEAIYFLERWVKIESVWRIKIVVCSVVVLFFSQAFVEWIKGNYIASVSKFDLVSTDNLDHTSEIKWIVTINNPVVFVFIPAIEEEIVEKVVVEPNTDVLSASIVSISSQGEMLVRFNATVQNSLNLTYLNEQIDIYLLPA